MVTMRLRGVHVVRRRLSSGEVREYHYAWRGGPRIHGKPGSPEYLARLRKALESVKVARQGTFREIITAYQASPEYRKLGHHSKRAYDRHIAQIESRFGTMPLAALEDAKVRRHFIDWRNTMQDRPRTADYAMTVLKRILSWAVSEVRLTINHAEPIGRLHSANRADSIWTPEEIEALRDEASDELMWAVELAMHTGLRQGDLTRLAWTHYDGESFAMTTSKRGRDVLIPATPECRAVMARIKKRHVTVLTTERGKRPWTPDGLRSSFGKACRDAGIKRTFHDLRRTAATNLMKAGRPASQVALIMGWEEDTVDALKRKYVSRSAVVQDMLAHGRKDG
ncbi:MAG: tyrosine-type recombinase/integrase [Brevundimonas sp.]|uniref:tyrosine-type recombinase/integrase n=1 Tax=Brevundimonas sp. TaxID=1871086 RepID=UPI00391C0690